MKITEINYKNSRKLNYLNDAKTFLKDGSGSFSNLLVIGMELNSKSIQEMSSVLEVSTSTILVWIEGDLAPLNKVQEFAIKHMIDELEMSSHQEQITQCLKVIEASRTEDQRITAMRALTRWRVIESGRYNPQHLINLTKEAIRMTQEIL